MIIFNMPVKDGHWVAPLILRIIPFVLLTGLLQLFLFPIWLNWTMAQSKGNASAGKITYEKLCSGCHGKQGEGIGNMPSFRDTQYMSSRTDLDFFQKITSGGQGTGMPPFSSRLPEEERWNVIAYIRTLAPAR
ncbi:MAG: c-type cytochrome [Nitrospiria bacterium]